MKCLYEGCDKASESGTGYCDKHYSEYDEYAEMVKAELRRDAVRCEMSHDDPDDLAPMSLAYEADCEQDRIDGIPDLYDLGNPIA